MVCVITLYVVSWIWSWIVGTMQKIFHFQSESETSSETLTPNRNGTESPNMIPDEDY